MNKNYDVIIAGCGPTGATLANYLGQQKLNVLIFDKESEIIEYPRAVHIDEDVIRIFQELNLYDNMKKDAIKPFKNYSLVTPKDKILFQFSPNNSISEEIPNCNWILQPEIERHLRNGFSTLKNVTFLSENQLENFSQDHDSVTIKLTNTYTNEKTTVRGRFLIGADGGKSLIRKLLNINVHDFGFKKSWMVVDTIYKGNNKFSEDHKQYCNPKQPITYVNGVRNHFRWEFMIKDEDENLSEKRLLDKMLPLLNKSYPIEEFQIIRKKKYTFHTLIAKKWRDGNIFLAGDAAHQMPPFLGQGMCSGIKDAKNLSWKIALASKKTNIETDELLDSYYNERAPQVTKIIKLAAILGGFIQYSNPILYPFRNNILKFINILPSKPIDKLIEKHLYSLPVKTILHKKNTLAGRRIPQPIVETVSGKHYLDKILGQDWILIYRNCTHPTVSSPFINAIELLGTLPKKRNQITSPTLQKWMNAYKIDFIILRPDKFIFHSGKGRQLPQIIKETIKYLTLLNQN